MPKVRIMDVDLSFYFYLIIIFKANQIRQNVFKKSLFRPHIKPISIPSPFNRFDLIHFVLFSLKYNLVLSAYSLMEKKSGAQRLETINNLWSR